MIRKAKIVCTIGPASRDPAVLDRLIEAGFKHVPARPANGREPSAWFETFPNAGNGWSPGVSQLALVAADGSLSMDAGVLGDGRPFTGA